VIMAIPEKPDSRARRVKLTCRHDFRLIPKPPFAFDATVNKPSHFPAPTEECRPGCFWNTTLFRDHLLGLRLRNSGDTDHPSVQLSVWSEAPLPASVLDPLPQEIAFRYNLQSDLREFRRLMRGDALTRGIWRRRRGLRSSCAYSLYELLMISIVLQNATVRRTVQMLNNLLNAFGQVVAFDGRELCSFWQPGLLSRARDSRLRDLRVGYRARTLSRVSKAFARGRIDPEEWRALSNTDLKNQLLSIYGVGPASAGILMFECFHRHEVVDHIPPWERKIFAKVLYNKESVEEERIINDARGRWGDYAALALHYIFEDLFWRHSKRTIPWLSNLIRL